MQKKFISIIWGYHAQILSFDAKQNYHMLPIEVMKNAWYDCEIFAIDAQVKIEDDPNIVDGVRVVYYKNLLGYFSYLWKNRRALLYSNTLTLKTLMVGLFGKYSIFMPHDQAIPLKEKKIKRLITLFFYRFFSSIRVVNKEEKDMLWIYNIHSRILPIPISEAFYKKNEWERSGFVFVWNLYHDKNPEFLIETMKILSSKNDRNILHIYWEDRYNKNGKNFSELVRESWLEEKIKIHGFVPHDKLAWELAQYMIYINTSISEWQCLTAYEASLAWCFPCLQKIVAFPSVFQSNALYHISPMELAENIIFVLAHKEYALKCVSENQVMIQEKYGYDYLKNETRDYLLSFYR